MNLKPIKASDISLTSPLQWDVYDNDHNLLLRKGLLIGDIDRIKSLAERGLLIEAHFADNIIRIPTPATASNSSIVRHDTATKITEKPSAYRAINTACKRLERLFYSWQSEADTQSKVLEIAKLITDATELNPDLALGCILLNQAACNYAVRHCVDTAIVATLIARVMQKTPDDIAIMVAAALTMNLGMLRQQDGMQSNRTALTDNERTLIKHHPQASVEALKQVGITHAVWLAHVMQHHENEDGSGYPIGKAVAGIAPTTKILALADRYCACVVQRQYRKIFLPQAALREVLFVGGQPRDPMLAALFIRELTNHPSGSMVRLQNKEIGIVTTRGTAKTPPVVRALFNAQGEPFSMPMLRDAGKEQYAIAEAVPNEQVKLRFSLQQLWGDDAAS